MGCHVLLKENLSEPGISCFLPWQVGSLPLASPGTLRYGIHLSYSKTISMSLILGLAENTVSPLLSCFSLFVGRGDLALNFRRQGWDDLREQHWNMYITRCKADDQCMFDAWSRASKAGTLGPPREMRWGGRVGPGWASGRLTPMYGKSHHNTVLILQLK